MNARFQTKVRNEQEDKRVVFIPSLLLSLLQEDKRALFVVHLR